MNELNCPKCGASKSLKLWGNKKGYTCQNCGYLHVIDYSSGLEDEGAYWGGEDIVRKC